MHYCIGDVHGCLDELLTVIKKIRKKDNEAVIYLMGDIIDQGPRVADTLLFAMENVTKDGYLRAIRGNHEEEVLLWYRKYLEWQNESVRTLFPPASKYDFYVRMKKETEMSDALLDRIADFFHNLPYSEELIIPAAETSGKKYIHYYLTHAWYSVSEDKDSERQRWINLFGRSCEGISDFEMKKYEESHPDEIPVVVCGHTPTVSAVYISSKSDVKNVNRPGLIGYRPNAIFTDGGCFHYSLVTEYPCMLCAICLETLEEIYPRSVRARMTDYNIITMRREYVKRTGEALPALTVQDLKRKCDSYTKTYLSGTNPYRQDLLSQLSSPQET